jgi:hypothetical protein
MTKAPEWTKEEFILLVSRPELFDEELVSLLPNRSAGAIGVVRAGIHSFHTGGDVSMLSIMMKDLLGSKETLVECPICKMAF